MKHIRTSSKTAPIGGTSVSASLFKDEVTGTYMVEITTSNYPSISREYNLGLDDAMSIMEEALQ